MADDPIEKTRNMRCFICNKAPPSDPHHLRTRKAGGSDDEYNLIPLCREDHSRLHAEGWGKILWKFPELATKLEEKGWAFMNGKLRRI